jgi:ELWxxDGT repeat protein
VHVASGAGGYVGAGWEQPAVVDDKLFLRTTSSTLWEIDSSTAKAKVVQNLTISGQHGLVAGSGGYNSIAAYKGNLFALTDNQLNLIDVERNTITPIATLSSSTFDEGFSGPLCLFQNDLYFAADTDAGPALFRSDGTAKGTTLIKAVNSDPLNIPPRVLDGEMYFEITGGETQIWSTNGTGKGTVDMSDEDVQAIPVDFNGTLFFFANGQLFEFKKGSSKALTQYPGESSTAQPVVIGGVLYFIAGDNNSGGTALYDYVAS